MELLSSHTSLRFLDVKGRPNGNGGSSPLPTETDSETFANRLQAAQEGRQEVSSSQAVDAKVSEAPAREDAKQASGGNPPPDQAQESSESSDALASSLWQDQQASASSASNPNSQATEFGGELLGSDPQSLLEGSSAKKPSEAAPLPATEEGFAAQASESGTHPLLPLEGIGTGVATFQLPQVTVHTQPWQESLAAWKVQGPETAPVTTNAKPQVASTIDFLPDAVADESGHPSLESAGKVNALLEAFTPDSDSSAGDWQPDGEALKPSTAAVLSDSAFESVLGETRAPQTGSETSVKVDAVQATTGIDRTPDMARHEAVMAQIQAKIQPGLQKATIRLNPEELGHIRVEVTVDKGEVRADLRVESKEALQILQRHVPELRALFAQADMELTDFNLQLADQDASQSSQGDSQDHPPSRSSRVPQSSSIPAPVESAQWTTLTLPTEGLNLLA